MSEEGALARIHASCPHIKGFLRAVRKAEGFLSGAQIEGGGALSKHNREVHEIALARQCFLHSRGRQSRFSSFAHANKEYADHLQRTRSATIPVFLSDHDPA